MFVTANALRVKANALRVKANALLEAANALLEAAKASPPCLWTWIEESVEHLS